MSPDLDLTRYKALSFDCYGTLIDWETGIAAVLAPWAREHGLDLNDEDLLLAYADNEAAVERETPSALYPDVLAMAFRRTGEKPRGSGGNGTDLTRAVDLPAPWSLRSHPSARLPIHDHRTVHR
jgi:FMN phosphatase YigB (HAD superfamily)